MEEKEIQEIQEKKEMTSEKIIKRHMYWSVAGGLIPIPLIDIAAVSAIQIDMLKSLCDLYNVDYSQDNGKAKVTALTSATLSRILARTGASIVKSVPAVGTVVGTVSMAIISGASSYAMGNVFVKHFESGGTLKDFSAKNFKELYDEKLEEGKELAKKMKDKYKEFTKKRKGKEKEQTAVSKMKELKKMKKQGLINDDEYDSMRKEIIKNFTE
jgi:uncharacterized protein (DUF697 family)